MSTKSNFNLCTFSCIIAVTYSNIFAAGLLQLGMKLHIHADRTHYPSFVDPPDAINLTDGHRVQCIFITEAEAGLLHPLYQPADPSQYL